MSKDALGGGRDDWPVAMMLRAFLARIWLPHDSIASFRRKLSRNLSLMTVIGFPLHVATNGNAHTGFRRSGRSRVLAGRSYRKITINIA